MTTENEPNGNGSMKNESPEGTFSANIKIPASQSKKVMQAIAGVDEQSTDNGRKIVAFEVAMKRPNVTFMIKRREPQYATIVKNGKKKTVDISQQAYEEEGLEKLLAETGFEQVRFHPSMTGREDEDVNDFWVLTAHRRGN